MNINQSFNGKEVADDLSCPSNHKEALLGWHNELLEDIECIEKELCKLINKRDILKIQIECFKKWNISTYSQLRLKVSIEMEKIISDIDKIRKKIIFMKELFDKVGNEIKALKDQPFST